MPFPPGRRRRERPVVRRVQRPTAEFPVVHLEAAPPNPKTWIVQVGGLSANQTGFTLDEIREFGSVERTWDLHCVWGWTRPALRWEGVPAARLIDAARPLPAATHVMARAMDGPYASCLTMAEARESLVAWRVDGAELSIEHGGPLRLVPPPNKWGYKSVKWIGSLTLIPAFVPGFWEEMVGNPHGDIPAEMLDLRFE